VFALSQYLATVCQAGPDAAEPAVFRSRAYRFAGSTPDLRLPKDPSALAKVLSGPDGASAHAVLSAPFGRVPLVGRPDGYRRAALLGAVTTAEATVLASVSLTIRPGAKQHQQPELVDASAVVASDRDSMIDMLAAHWADALPEARAAAAGASAVWLGSDPRNAGGRLLADAAAVSAAYGLDLEVVRDVPRMTKEIATRLGGRPPVYVVVWVPHAGAGDKALAAYQQATEEGQVVRLLEPAEPDAIVELRMQLDELGLADPTAPQAATRTPPAPGEERFYIKSHGSGVGDIMIDVADCGHGQWGADCRRKAPRALKGITTGEGVTPSTLFRCEKCSKHRWRARF